jgi:hypothetical protein
VLYEAYDKSKAPDDVEYWEDHHGYAAELRALAEEIDARICNDQPVEAVIELFRAEASRAEAGE